MIDLSQYATESIPHGKSAASVYRLTDGHRTSVYLKTAPVDLGYVLKEESSRYTWLRTRLPVPDVIAYGVVDNREHLVLSVVPGLPAFDLSLPRPKVIECLADGLRMFHALPVRECPFDMSLDVRIEMASKNAAEGRVDLEDLQPEHRGWRAEMLLDEVYRTRPTSEDLVVIHGDYCLPNVILAHDASRINGFIDIGYCGVGDRYQDLALAWRSIRYNFGEEYVASFFEAYGVTEPDREKIAFYNLLDELF